MVHTAQARRPQRRGSGRRGRQRAMSALWGAVQAADTDPITALAAALKDDPHPDKVGLCQGKYMDEQGQPYLLRAVEQAEAEIVLHVSARTGQVRACHLQRDRHVEDFHCCGHRY